MGFREHAQRQASPRRRRPRKNAAGAEDALHAPKPKDVIRMACPPCHDASRRGGMGLMVGAGNAGWPMSAAGGS